MPTTWLIHRLRSAFFHENLLLMVLGLLKDSELSEWEVLEILYSRYRLTPNAKEFRKLVESLVTGGYAGFETAEGARKLRITGKGIKLLRSLEGEYRAIVSHLSEARDTGTVLR
jgi:hypothetical protein